MASPSDKSLVWLHGQIKTPPFSKTGRLEVGLLLRRLQRGEILGLPQSRPMPGIGPQCHELRVNDAGRTWRIMYHLDPEAVVILDVFAKKTATTPRRAIQTCRRRLAAYWRVTRETEE